MSCFRSVDVLRFYDESTKRCWNIFILQYTELGSFDDVCWSIQYRFAIRVVFGSIFLVSNFPVLFRRTLNRLRKNSRRARFCIGKDINTNLYPKRCGIKVGVVIIKIKTIRVSTTKNRFLSTDCWRLGLFSSALFGKVKITVGTRLELQLQRD